MGSLCLSSASILRCESFTRTQVVILIIPTALEVMFSTSLIITNWGAGRRHLWLTAEGLVYFALAFVEMLSHILPIARDNGKVFKSFDTVLAATSFLPILFYMIFLYLFACSDLIIVLPTRFQTIAKLLLLAFIPTVVALNEVASFVGISTRFVPSGSNLVLAIGFKSDKDQIIWTFFTSLTLALLTAYQAINFLFIFYRLVKVFIDQNRIESASNDEAHFFKGTAWINGAYKLGAIETVVGFAGAGFGGAMTRRIFRLLARAFLCIGLVRGIDSVEDFQQVRNEIMITSNRKEFRQSRLRDFISNPRLSTFRQLTPTATAFHSAPRAPRGLSQLSPSIRATEALSGMGELAMMKSFLDISGSPRKPRERVTVHICKGAPTLHLRFSALAIPSPMFSDTYGSQSERAPNPSHVAGQRGPSEELMQLPLRPTSSLLSSLHMSDSGLAPTSHPPLNHLPVKQPQIDSYTTPSDRPNPPAQPHILPPPALRIVQQSRLKGGPQDFWEAVSPMSTHRGRDRSDLAYRSLSKREPVPTPLAHNSFGSNDGLPIVAPIIIPLGQPIRTLRASTQLNYGVNVPTSPTTPMTTLSGYMQTPLAVCTPDTEHEFAELGSAKNTRNSRELMKTSHRNPEFAQWADYGERRPTIVEQGQGTEIYSASTTVSLNNWGRSEADMSAISWLRTPDIEEEHRVAKMMGKKPQLSRIKSVGKAPRRSTPTPTRTGYTRGSLHIEPIMIPPKEHGWMEIIQGSLDSASSRSVLRDSEVLGIEDGSYARAVKEQGYSQVTSQ